MPTSIISLAAVGRWEMHSRLCCPPELTKRKKEDKLAPIFPSKRSRYNEPKAQHDSRLQLVQLQDASKRHESCMNGTIPVKLFLVDTSASITISKGPARNAAIPAKELLLFVF